MVNSSSCLFCCIHPTIRLKIFLWQQPCVTETFPYRRYLYWDVLTGCILASRPSAFPRTGQWRCCIWGSSSCRQLSSARSYGDNSKSRSHTLSKKEKKPYVLFLNVLIWRAGKKKNKKKTLFTFLYTFQIEIKLIATVGDFGQAPWFLDTEMLCSWLCGTALYKQQWLNFKSTYEWILALLT